MTKKIEFIEIKSELGAGKRGSSLGIDAMKIVAIEQQNTLFSQHPISEIQHQNHLWHQPTDTPNAKRIVGFLSIMQHLAHTIEQKITQSAFPIVLSSDHSIAAGTLTGIKKAHPKQRIGVIWIDAHADIHSPYTSFSGNLHGMPLAIALNEDNLKHQQNTPSSQTVQYWNQAKQMGNIYPKIEHQDVVFISMRDVDVQEDELIKEKNIKNFTTKEVQQKGTQQIASEALAYLQKCDLIYISFDVDSIDPSYSVGTGTPVSGGLTPQEAQELLLELAQSNKLSCLEITEINPLIDTENKMAKMAFNILNAVVTALKSPKK